MNKTALITGGATRLGRSMALSLAKKGYAIAIHYNTSKKETESLKKALIQTYKIKTESFKANLSDKNELEKLIENINNWQPIDVLINNASNYEKETFDTLNDEVVENQLALHLVAPLKLTKALIKSGIIINMTDATLHRNNKQHWMYQISKSALENATKYMASELSPDIRVNAIAPGWILNPEPKNKSIKENDLIKKIPLKRKGKEEDICKTLNFLLESDYITGQVIYVDGGRHLT